MHISTPRALTPPHAALGEGPLWDAAHQQLYWVDILPGRLHRYQPATNRDEWMDLGEPLGFVALARGGDALLGLKSGLAALAPGAAQWGGRPAPGELRHLAQPEAHLPDNRFNDGKCGPDGRLLAGTMDMTEKNASGALYSLAPNGNLQTLHTGVRISNGLAWSADGATLYYIDTPTRAITAFDYDLSNGQIANPRIVITIPAGLGWPDGMTIDQAGRLWVAMWQGAALTVWNPSAGQLLETVRIPARNVTSCAFGGPDLTDLYVTSARVGLDDAELAAFPDSGSLFRMQTNVTGSLPSLFGN